MTTYNEFSIQEVIPDLSQKRIEIHTNFKVDPTSVSNKTVAFYDYDKAKLETYNLQVDGKNIYINLFDYPDLNQRSFLKISNIKDALGRTLATDFNDYIKFNTEVKSTVSIIKPLYRESLTTNLIEIQAKVNIVDNEQNLKCRIEIGIDNAFFSSIATVYTMLPNTFLNNSNTNDLARFTTYNGVIPSETTITDNIMSIATEIDRQGQLYIRARMETSDNVVGDWSETVSFSIYTVPMESVDTTFLEDYLTPSIVFEDELSFEPTEVLDVSSISTNEGAFYIEFNKEIVVPNGTPDEEGYISLGTIIGTRKGYK